MRSYFLPYNFPKLVKLRPLFQAELFRIKKDFDNAEPLYLEAIDILEKHFGTEDI
ncbi:hypothetical protein OROHE_005992, partial [Orobanche hederae]